MKFTITSSALYAQLLSISRVIVTKSAFPILDSFLLDVQEGKLVLTGSDNETRLSTEVPLISQEGTGKLAISSKMLIDGLKEVSDQPVTFEVKGVKVRVSYQNGQYELVAGNAEDYPAGSIPEEENSQKIIIASEVLKRGLSHTIFAVGNDELRPVMNGVYLDLTDKDITFVASDGHKLIKYTTSDACGSENGAFILPSKPGNLLKALLKNNEDQVKLTFDGKQAQFIAPGLDLRCRLLEGRYPNYRSVIPTNNPFHVIVDRLSLVGALKRVQVFTSQENNLVKLDISSDQILLTAQDLDFSIAGEERVICSYEGEPMKIGFKARFMIEQLLSCEAEQVQLQLADPSRPGVMIPVDSEENGELIMLLMPLLLNE